MTIKQVINEDTFTSIKQNYCIFPPKCERRNSHEAKNESASIDTNIYILLVFKHFITHLLQMMNLVSRACINKLVHKINARAASTHLYNVHLI